jgi:hypothetical protein
MELDLPWLRLRTKCAPEIFGYVSLQMRWIADLWRGVQTQIERHLMRRFAGAHEPAEEGVFRLRGGLEDDLMGAKADVGQFVGDGRGGLQLATPNVHGDSIWGNAARVDDVLATSKAGRDNGLRALEKLVLWAAGDHSTAIQHE